MLKKRIIFTLIYSEEHFMLSRNFRLQKVGSLGWLKRNYDFSRIAYSIDELVILNATRGNKGKEAFAQHVKELNSECFVPIAAGGGIRTVEEAKQLLRCGADKIVLNSLLALNPKMVSSMATEFGRQCIIASVDLKLSNNSYNAWIENGSHILDQPAQEWLECVSSQPIGELYVNSISRDGTGQGYDVHILDLIPDSFNRPIILAGGAGKYEHFA
jgi:cyclase